jgi:G:T-mismatch repair DNA endonuclease (very short patch repair protein)
MISLFRKLRMKDGGYILGMKYDYNNHYDANKDKYFYFCFVCKDKTFISGKRGLRHALANERACSKCKHLDPRSKYQDPEFVESRRERNSKRFIELNTGPDSPGKTTENRKKSSDRMKNMLADPNSKMSIAQANLRAPAHAEDSCQRACPGCNQIINYNNRAARLNADRKEIKCNKCAIIDRIKYPECRDTNGKLFKTCPQCSATMTYDSQTGFEYGIKNNSVCQVCQGLNIRKPGFDQYYNQESGTWEKPCSQCKTSIMSYETKKHLMRSVNGNFFCKSCDRLRRIVDQTKLPGYIPSVKIIIVNDEPIQKNEIKTKEVEVWIRSCPQCSCNINYASHRSFRIGNENNYRCASCVMTEVSNRPEQRAKSSNTMKKILTTAWSKKELELFELIKHLGFTHNDGANLINIEGYFPDMVHNQHKLLVEFYGDRYHANPRNKKFGPDDAQIKFGREIKLAKNIRERDAKRQKILEKAGYRVIIVWEDMFNLVKNRPIIVEKIENVVKRFDEKLNHSASLAHLPDVSYHAKPAPPFMEADTPL